MQKVLWFDDSYPVPTGSISIHHLSCIPIISQEVISSLVAATTTEHQTKLILKTLETMASTTSAPPKPTLSTRATLKAAANPVAKSLEPFVCGGAAATFASCVIHPMDLAKVRMQLYGQLNPGKPVPSFVDIISSMVKNDGITSVYKGVDAAIGRQMVYGTARIGLHRTFSDKLVEMNDGKPISFAQKTVSGMASGSIAVCIGTPFDIALVRLQADGMAKPEDRRNYKNVFDVSIIFDCSDNCKIVF